MLKYAWYRLNAPFDNLEKFGKIFLSINIFIIIII